MAPRPTQAEVAAPKTPSEAPTADRGWRRWARSSLAVALLIALPAVMLQAPWLAPTSAGEDDLVYYYPLRKLAGQALRDGRWPAHNALESTGMPVLADPQSAVTYPPTWLFAVLAAPLAYSVTLLLGFSMAGAGTWAYLRRLGLARPAAAFGAVAFMFCGFLVGHRVHWSVLHAAAWLPWGLWGIELIRTRPAAALAVLAPVGWLALAAGHWPTVIHVGLIWTAYLLFRARPWGRAAAVAAAAAVLAAALAWPQIDLTRQLLAAATRSRVGYATAGENSFWPPAAALAMFPFLFGSRTPNFFPQQWWGPWHLCEMLGYVGLSTLVLALAGAWSLRRKEIDRSDPSDLTDRSDQFLHPVVRAWTWIGLGAGVWMLGYYLPSYRLIHMLPVLGVVRCPARMVLGVDMALAALAAIAIHAVLRDAAAREKLGTHPSFSPSAAAPSPVAREKLGCVPSFSSFSDLPLRRGIARGATFFLPGAMVGVLLLTAAAGWVSMTFFAGRLAFFNGGGADALRAVAPTSPAVWVPLALAAVTAAVLRAWLARPAARAPVLVCLLLVDLFFITRFVDTPAAGVPAPDPEVSPAAAWLRINAPPGGPWRVWGIGRDYHDRAAELLLPKTACSLGIGTINTYGPFQSPALPHLTGFRIFGTNRDWAWLLRENRLLSLYGVRYVLTDRPDVRQAIEAIRSPEPGARNTEKPGTRPIFSEGNMLSDDWWLDRAERRDGVLRLATPWMWHWSIAKQPLEGSAFVPGATYRISLEARAPAGGAANFLRADLLELPASGGWRQRDELALVAHEEQLGADWRRLAWTFRAPDGLAGRLHFRVFTMSERPIEVRDVALRAGEPDAPRAAAGRLAAGEAVYRKVAELPAVDGRSAPVVIYENRLVRPAGERPPLRRMTGPQVEAVKWSRDVPPALPELGLRVEAMPARALQAVTLPAALVWLVVLAGALLRRRER